MHLDRVVHVLNPLVCLLDRFFSRRIDHRLKIGARLHVDGELSRQLKVDRIQPACVAPLRCQVLHGCGWGHGFTIQLGTSRRKRAATSVLPVSYCTATTLTSSSSEPSELRIRKMSAKSSGVFEANRTSRGVPNSMTVLSLKSVGAPASITRAICTGTRIEVASGKKRASPATGLTFCPLRAVAVA